MTGSKVTAILLNGWILSIVGASAVRGQRLRLRLQSAQQACFNTPVFSFNLFPSSFLLSPQPPASIFLLRDSYLLSSSPDACLFFFLPFDFCLLFLPFTPTRHLLSLLPPSSSSFLLKRLFCQEPIINLCLTAQETSLHLTSVTWVCSNKSNTIFTH